MASEYDKVKALFDKLVESEDTVFPLLYKKLDAPTDQGVYIIYSPKGSVVHVGRTPKAKDGIAQRLRNHMSGSSSFTYYYLREDGSKLRGKYKFKSIVVRSPRIRALLEAYTIGRLCPKHLGVG